MSNYTLISIHCIPAFTDNYFWLIQPDHQHPESFIVDPGDATPVQKFLKERQLTLKAILLTHHHHDHIDGALELSEKFNVPIYGPKSPKIPIVTHYVYQNKFLDLNTNLVAQILEVPGHTKDHIAYFIDSENPFLFSGDTIFSAGCGRIFDGDAESFFLSIERIKKLPKNTLIFSAHEYTQANLRFAAHIEPSNPMIQLRLEEVKKLRESNQPSLPTVLKAELSFNPFLRTQIAAVRDRVRQLSGQACDSEQEVFTNLRKLKDQFV